MRGRKRTGSKFFDPTSGIWYGRVTVDLIGGGTERSAAVPLGVPGQREADAEVQLRALAKRCSGKKFPPRADLNEELSDPVFEDYYDLHIAYKRAKGNRSVRKDLQRIRDHVIKLVDPDDGKPLLKGKRMREIQPTDLRRVVRALDKRAADPTLRFDRKTAVNTWSALTALFGEAVSSKDDRLLVLKKNPCDDVQGPDAPLKKVKQWLYPYEFERLISCGEVPLRWRRIYAVSVYLYLRLGEVRALTWDRIDLHTGMIRIDLSADEFGRDIREYTKNNRVRSFRYEPALHPLLVAMSEESGGNGQLFGSVDKAPQELRRHLKAAKIDRQELHHKTALSLPLWFHDLRATGITWAALRGDPSIAIRDRAGHDDIQTTDDYIRRASSAGDVGTPFPRLDALLSNKVVVQMPTNIGSNTGSGNFPISDYLMVSNGYVVRRGGLEPPWE